MHFRFSLPIMWLFPAFHVQQRSERTRARPSLVPIQICSNQDIFDARVYQPNIALGFPKAKPGSDGNLTEAGPIPASKVMVMSVIFHALGVLINV
ncbi:MAG TPA: hypothetical protein DDZ84_07260, partial [Firmicutes bacterium]|nr:hypothetical protein [Bacillota bacterium]